MSDIRTHAEEHSDDIVAVPGPETEALAMVNAYQDGWNLRDIEAMNAAFHFPHVRIASGRIDVMEEPLPNDPKLIERFIEQTGWHYSLWDYRRAIQSTEDKVHFALQFTRYRKDDSVIGHYPSMWVVAKIAGRWGVQARSSFAP